MITKEGTTEKAYQAMVDAGLLKSKTSLTNAELQNTIATATNNEVTAKAAMLSMGLSIATEGEEAQTVQLTTKKLQEAVATGILNEAQAQQIAMTTGVTLAQSAQIASTMPKFIAMLKAMAIATWGQVKATAVWLATTPAGWATAAIASIVGVIAVISHHNKKIEEQKQEIRDLGEEARNTVASINSDFKSTKSTVNDISKKYAELAQGVKNLGTTSQNQGSLSTDEYSEFLDISNQLSEIFPSLTTGYDENGNAILSLNGDIETITSSLNNLVSAEEQAASLKIADEMDDIYKNYNLNVSEYADQYNTILNERKELENYLSQISANGFITDGFAYLGDDVFELSKQLDIISKVNPNINAKTIFDKSTMGEAFTEDEIIAIKNAFATMGEQYQKELNGLSVKIDAENKQFGSYIINSLKSNALYNRISEDFGTEGTNLVNSIFSNLSYDTLLSEFDGNWDKALRFLETNILSNFTNLTNEEKADFQDIYTNLLSIDPNAALSENIPLIEEYISKLSEILGIEQEQLKISFGFDTDNDKNKLQTIKDRLGYTDNVTNETDAVKNKEINSFVDTLNSDDAELIINAAIPDEVLNGTIHDWKHFLDELQNEANNNDLELNINPTSSLDNIQNTFSSFESIFDDIQSGSSVAADSIEALNETFGKLDGGTALQEFRNVLTTMPDDIDAQQAALNKLATTYLDNSDLIQNLTEENADYVTSELEKIGVMNAEEVVQSRLASQTDWLSQAQQQQELIVSSLASNMHSETDEKKQAYLASIDLQKATLDDITALIAEANAAGIDTTALSNYALQLIRAGQIPVTTDGSIKNLADFADQISETNEMSLLYSKMNYYNSLGTAAGYAAAMALEKEIRRRSVATIRSGQHQNTSVQYGSPNYSPSSGSTNNGSGNSKEKFSQTFDWLDRRLSRLTTQTERWAAIIENATDAKRLNTYYKKLQSGYFSLAKTYSTAANYYLKRAENVGLSAAYKNKVKNGTIKLEEITNEKLAGKITSYQEYWDKYQEYLDDFIEAQEKLANVPLEKAASKIELLSDALDLLDATLDNISVKNYKKANANLDTQTQNVKKQLDADKEAQTAATKNYQAAISAVQKKANLGADDLAGSKNKQTASKKAIQTAVSKENEINLALYKEGSSGYKAAVKYNAALKAQKKAINAAALSQEEYTKTLRENAKAKFDNISNYYSSRIGLRDNEISAIDNKISELEAAGKNVDKSYYEEQKKINNRKLNFYKDEKSELEESLKSIPKYTDEWYDAKDAIQECENAISDCVEETYNLNNAINELYFDMFNDIADGIDRIISEQEFLQSLFAHENLTDSKTGGFTNAGMAKLGSLSASYYASKEKANNDAKLLQDLQNVRDKGKKSDGTYKVGEWTFNSLDDLQAKIDETYTTWQNDIKETYNYESDIADLMKDKYDAELDLLQELIDAKKEALQAEKDLHDYQQTIQEKTQDISTIQKQIAAYQGDSSGEGLAKLQKLQVQLSEKEKDLRETEYDKYISDQEDMLDKLYSEYEELVTKKLDDFMKLMQDGLNTANENSVIIKSYLSKIASDNEYTAETKELFNNPATNIVDSVTGAIGTIEKRITDNSGTTPQDSDNGGGSKGSTGSSASDKTGSNAKDKQTSSLVGIIEKLSLSKADYRNIAKNYIKKNARKASKKRGEYGAVNQAIYDNKSKAYNGTGKILSASKLKGLAKELDIKYDNATEKGTLYKKLKSIKFPGFSKGGIVSVDDVKRQVTENGDTGLVSVHNGEGILTPLQTTLFGELTQKLPELNQALNLMGNIVDLPSLPTLSDIPTIKNNTTIGDMVFNIDLPNVTNPEEFVKAIQNEPKVQKALRAVTTDRLTGNGRLSVRNII